MKIFPPKFEIAKGEVQRTVLTVGNFDGLHLGHRQILKRLKARAKRIGGRSGLVSFVPHPLRVLCPEKELEILTSLEQKVALLEEFGIDLLVLLAFTKDLADVTAEAFIQDYLVENLGVVELYVGTDFSFGRGGEGDLPMLRTLGKKMNFKTRVVEKLLSGKRPISSSRIRGIVKAGRVAEASKMLGRPYTVEGRVSRGAGRGKTIGFPTINLEGIPQLLPAPGVYITETTVGEKRVPSASYIGPRLTFKDKSEAVESHLLDYEEEIYGEWVRLTFLKRLRPATRFRGVKALQDAIAKDIAKARQLFKSIS